MPAAPRLSPSHPLIADQRVPIQGCSAWKGPLLVAHAWVVIGLVVVGTLASPVIAETPCAPGFETEARQTLLELDQTGGFTGTVLVARGGLVVLRHAQGLADRDRGIANRPDTRFRIGSTTKTFTAVAVLKLAEAGRLSIDDPLSRHLSDIPPAWSGITLRQLLTHTSGVPEFLAVEAFHESGLGRPHTPRELTAFVAAAPLDFEPGSDWRYSNTGYILLGQVIEAASGRPYGDYLGEALLTPLGMNDTGYETAGSVPTRGYGQSGSNWLDAPTVDPSNAYAAGGLYSTVDDLKIWGKALSDDQLLSAASRAVMFTAHSNAYGLGWSVDRRWDRDRLSHGGATPGFQTGFERYPQAQLTVVALSNSDLSAAEKLASDLAGLCLGAQPYPPEIAVPGDRLQAHVGTYVGAHGTSVVVERRDTRLTARFGDQPAALAFPTEDDRFFLKVSDAQLRFDPQGLTVRQNGQDHRFDRRP